MKRAIATLSDKQWVTAPLVRLDLLLSYFFLCQPSQEYVFKGNVYSAQALLQKHSGDINRLCDGLQEGLATILQRHFDSAEVNIHSSTFDDDTSNLADLTLTAVVFEGGIRYDLARALQIDGSKFKIVSDTLNGD